MKEEDKKIEFSKKIKECQKEKEEYLQGWQRARADFINYKRNESERITDVLRYQKEEMLLEIVSVLDNFENAEREIPKEHKKDNYLKGLLRIKDQLLAFLKKEGVERVDSLNKEFDPSYHEVVEEIESEEKPGIIIEEIQKGYFLGDKLLRAAKVKISKQRSS